MASSKKTFIPQMRSHISAPYTPLPSLQAISFLQLIKRA